MRSSIHRRKLKQFFKESNRLTIKLDGKMMLEVFQFSNRIVCIITAAVILFHILYPTTLNVSCIMNLSTYLI